MLPLTTAYGSSHILRRTQAKRKEQKKEQVLKAIAEIRQQKKPLTFRNISTVAGCSISYLYKWDEIKAYIHELQHQKQTTINSVQLRIIFRHNLANFPDSKRYRC